VVQPGTDPDGQELQVGGDAECSPPGGPLPATPVSAQVVAEKAATWAWVPQLWSAIADEFAV